MDRVREPLICRLGYHTFRFTHMANVRLVGEGAHSQMLVEIVEKCRRCPITRTRYFNKVPRRVKR